MLILYTLTHPALGAHYHINIKYLSLSPHTKHKQNILPALSCKSLEKMKMKLLTSVSPESNLSANTEDYNVSSVSAILLSPSSDKLDHLWVLAVLCWEDLLLSPSWTNFYVGLRAEG